MVLSLNTVVQTKKKYYILGLYFIVTLQKIIKLISAFKDQKLIMMFLSIQSKSRVFIELFKEFNEIVISIVNSRKRRYRNRVNRVMRLTIILNRPKPPNSNRVFNKA